MTTYDSISLLESPPAPPVSPAPPDFPPGAVKHETCQLHVTSVLDNTAMQMQIAELAIFNRQGIPMSVSMTSADCEPVTAETGEQATDGSVTTKWFCYPFIDGVGATLTVEFETADLLGAYQLTTANDYPARDPTSWSLVCSVDGVAQALSTVEDIVPPEGRYTVYDAISLLPSPPAPPVHPPMPPHVPLPPVMPPLAAPSPGAPCTPVTITTVTTNWGYEQSWTIDSSKMEPLESTGFGSYATDVSEVRRRAFEPSLLPPVPICMRGRVTGLPLRRHAHDLPR